ncbi:MAG: alpha/beta hydrolase [Pseudomonadota bacterium]
MARIAANGIDIEAQAHGPSDGAPVLLIRGLGSQLIHWPTPLIDGLTEAGCRAILFDNRDSGLSARCPDAPYGLEDMADDAAGVLDAFGVAAAHVLGISMGGRIAQLMALAHRPRLLSATLVMTSSGAPGLPGRTPEVEALLLAQPDDPSERAGVVRHTLAADRVWGSPGFPFDEAERRALIERAYDRAWTPAGLARQYAAIRASFAHGPSGLEDLDLPTTVIHGTDDALISVEHGRDLAARIPGAELIEIEGMGHDLEGDVALKVAEAVIRRVRRGP